MDNEKRLKRAKSIAAMGLVKRGGDKFIVTNPSLRGHQTTNTVWRNSAGKVICNCLEFEAEILDEKFRCEHILAVKEALVQKLVGNDAIPEKPKQTAQTASSEQETVSLSEYIRADYAGKFQDWQINLIVYLEKDGKIRSFLTRGDLKK